MKVISTIKTNLSTFSKWTKSWMTMKRGQCLFRDTVDGKEVFEYTDCFGDKYMANFSRWGMRCKMERA